MLGRLAFLALPLSAALAAGGCRRDAGAGPARAQGPAVSGGTEAAAGGPRRVVSLAPSLTEIAFAVGAGGRLVGVDDYVEFPEEAKRLPRVGSLLNQNIETILALRPDLVLLVRTFRSAADKLEGAGVKTLVVANESLEDLDGAVAAVGHALAAEAGAARLRASLKADLDGVARAVAARGRPRPSVAFVLDRRPGSLADLYVAGRRSFLGQLVDVAGGRNVFDDVAEGAARVGVEELLRRAPEVVLDATADADAQAAWAALPTLPAVRHGRVIAVGDDRLTVPGPRTGAAARRLAALLQGPLETARGR